jgi:hypothetical protein
VVARAVIVNTEPHVAVEPGCAVLPLLHMVLVHQAGNLKPSPSSINKIKSVFTKIKRVLKTFL